jgi:hypothetical protein
MSSRDLLFDVDLLVTARKLGFGVTEVPTVWIDQAGSRMRSGPDSFLMAASALRLWLHHQLLPVEAAGADPDDTVVDLRAPRRVSA